MNKDKFTKLEKIVVAVVIFIAIVAAENDWLINV